MIIIHKISDLLPVINYLSLLLVFLPIATGSESDSQDFYISSDQLLHNEPQIIIENDNDQLLQEAFDPSKLEELNDEDKGDLESFKSIVIQKSSNHSLDLTSEEDTINYSLTADNNLTIQKLPKSATVEESPNTYKDQPVKFNLHSIPAHQYITKEPSQQQQYTAVNNEDALFNQVNLNQQDILDQAKDTKLPQHSNAHNTYWEFPHVNYPLPRDQYLSDPSFMEDYYPSYDDLFNFDSNIDHKKNPNNYWMSDNQGHNVLSDNSYNSTIDQLSDDLSDILNPLKVWFDKNYNDLTPHIIPQFQPYKYEDSEISERHSLPPNRYQNSYYTDNHFIGNQPNIYKPLDSEHFSKLSHNKNSIPEPLNGMPLLNQYRDDSILRPTFEQHPDTIAPEIVLDYNQGNIYHNLPRDQVSETEPLYNIPLDNGFENKVEYYDPVDVGNVPHIAFYTPSIKPKAAFPLSLGRSSKPKTVYNVKIDQGSNYQRSIDNIYDVPIDFNPLAQATIDSHHIYPIDQNRKTQSVTDNHYNDQLDRNGEFQSSGDYLHHFPLYQGSKIVAADYSPLTYPTDQVKKSQVDSYNPIGLKSTPKAVEAITPSNPIDQERKTQSTTDDSQNALKHQTIQFQDVKSNDTVPMNQEHNPLAYIIEPYIVTTDQVSEHQAFEDFTDNLDQIDRNSRTKTTDDNLNNDQINQNIKPQKSGAYSNNIPIDVVSETQGNDEDSYDNSRNKGHNPNELSDNPHNVPMEQRSETKSFGNLAYNIPKEPVNLAQEAYINQQSSLNQNNQSFVSEKSINKIINEPWAWFSEHPGIKELRRTLNSDKHLAVNNQDDIDKNVQVPIENTNNIEHHKNSDLEGTQQSLFDTVDIKHLYKPIHRVEFDKNNTIPDDKGSNFEFTQDYNKQFSKNKSSSFEINELNNKQDDALTPSLFLSRIFYEILHQVEESEEDVKSSTSPLLDYSKDTDAPITSDIDTTYILQNILADQIRMWDNPEIYVNQPLNGGRIDRIDQHIINDPHQISTNRDIKMNLAMSQDYYTDLSVEEILSKMYSKPISDINPPLIPIDLSFGIRQSAGNTTNSNSPYLAVDYDSPARYSTFWNPRDLPFGFSAYYIIFDFKTIYTVTKMYIMNYGDMVHDITAFKLEVWDGSGKWRMISNFFCQAGIGKSQEFGGFIGTGRYWMFTSTKTASGYQPWLVELSFHGLEDYGEFLDYLDDTSSDISTEPENSKDSEEELLGDTVVAKQNRDGPLHIPTWIYYLVGLVVLALAMLSMSCLIIHMAKKRNGLYNITLVMGKGKEDSVTPIGSHPSKDYDASAPPALPPATPPEAKLDSNIGVYQIQTRIQ